MHCINLLFLLNDKNKRIIENNTEFVTAIRVTDVRLVSNRVSFKNFEVFYLLPIWNTVLFHTFFDIDISACRV